MKKLYIAPQSKTFKLAIRQMICTSTYNVTLDGSKTFGSGQTVNSRDGSFWDDDDE